MKDLEIMSKKTSCAPGLLQLLCCAVVDAQFVASNMGWITFKYVLEDTTDVHILSSFARRSVSS
jgi:hypothetical protein